MKKTLVSGPHPIRCSHCTETTELQVDLARGQGWRVGWRPDHATWCPDCFAAAVKRVKEDEAIVEDPLF